MLNSCTAVRSSSEAGYPTKEKAEAIAETQLTLLQLHQVQEELENYFMQTRHAEQIVVAQQDQLLRAQALITICYQNRPFLL